MSYEETKKIIERLQRDQNFFKKILSDPREALREYDLSDSDLDFFVKADRKTLEGLTPECFEIAEKALFKRNPRRKK